MHPYDVEFLTNLTPSGARFDELPPRNVPSRDTLVARSAWCSAREFRGNMARRQSSNFRDLKIAKKSKTRLFRRFFNRENSTITTSPWFLVGHPGRAERLVLREGASGEHVEAVIVEIFVEVFVEVSTNSGEINFTDYRLAMVPHGAPWSARSAWCPARSPEGACRGENLRFSP